tara:strand:+ start:783 stop:1538 length:756 start_codon:yes stop_codon:yes gene_type:complete
MSIFSKLRKAWRTIKNIPNMIANAIKNAIERMFRKAFAGVLEMIENFKRIICFLQSIPKRSRNITSGVNNIFKGVGKKYEAIGKSIGVGVDSTSNLFIYSGEWAKGRLACVIKFILNLYKCILFYILKAIYSILCIIILEPIKFIGSLFGIDMNKNIDKAGKGIIEIDAFFYSIFGFHLIYFPESIRKDCFTCVRLKDSAVSKVADKLAWTFNTKIPYIMSEEGGDPEFKRAQNQFFESSVLVPREPQNVH